MTDSQRMKWNRMVEALRLIARGYMTPDQLRENCEKEYGLEYEEALEMSYENLQLIAEQSVKGIKTMKIGITESKQPPV